MYCSNFYEDLEGCWAGKDVLEGEIHIDHVMVENA